KDGSVMLFTLSLRQNGKSDRSRLGRGNMRAIPFSIVAPATIVFFGAGVAFVTILLGLRELQTRADDAINVQAQFMAEAISPRITNTPKAHWPGLLNKISGSCQ